jgi:ABC-type taurine transport system substrate-binding protein
MHVIAFSEDCQAPAPLGRRVAELAGNGHFHLLQGLGHVSCEVHKPEVVNAKIREIIASEGMAP